MTEQRARELLRSVRQRETQALGAALSNRNWQAMEAAYNQLRDKLDAMLMDKGAWVTIPARDGTEARYGLNDTYPGDPVRVSATALAESAKSPSDSVREALDDLQQAEAEYRLMHDRHGDGARATGRAWDLMRRAGDKARAALQSSEADNG